MANVLYTAQRDVASGHTAGLSYNFDFYLIKADEQPSTSNKISRSIDGSIKTVNYYHDVMWSLTTGPVLRASTSWNYWREFLSSVRAGESFTLDVYGTNAVPDSAVTMVLSGNPSYSREGSSEYFTINFNCIYNENF